MVDTSFAMEQVGRIDKEVNKIFPETRNILFAANTAERKQLYKEMNDLLFEGDLMKGLDETKTVDFVDLLTRNGATPEGVETILNGIKNSRSYFVELLKAASNSPSIGDLPRSMQGEFSSLLGSRVKDSIANTFEILSLN